MNYYHRAGDRLQTVLADARLGMLGAHQAANAAVALAVCERLQEQGAQLSESGLRRGLEQAYSPARIEILSWQPTVIMDTAHNVASIEALLDVLRAAFRSGRDGWSSAPRAAKMSPACCGCWSTTSTRSSAPAT